MEKRFEANDRWENGLCREFTKAVSSIIISYHEQEGRDLEMIGSEVISLYKEIFDH